MVYALGPCQVHALGHGILLSECNIALPSSTDHSLCHPERIIHKPAILNGSSTNQSLCHPERIVHKPFTMSSWAEWDHSLANDPMKSKDLCTFNYTGGARRAAHSSPPLGDLAFLRGENYW